MSYDFDVLILIFVRMIGFISIVPILGGKNVPIMMRVGFCIALTLIVGSTGLISGIAYDDTILGYGILIAKEFAVGYILGFVVLFMLDIAYMAGQLTDQQIGLSMANVYDPITQVQVPVTGNLYYFVLSALFIAMGGHRMVISTLIYSYNALPIGSAVIVGNEFIFAEVISLIKLFFVLGFMIAFPIVGVVLVVDVVLGVLVRAVPRMNVFVVGMPLKLIIGFIAMLIIVPMFSNVYEIIYNHMTQALLEMIKAMMPRS